MNRLLRTILVAFLCGVLASCSAERNDEPIWDPSGEEITREVTVTAVVTIKKDAGGKVFFQYGKFKLLSDGTYAYTRQERTMGQITVYPEKTGEYYRCSVHWMEPVEEGIFTDKLPISWEDGLDLYLNSWITGCDDGYLTLHYKTWWGEQPRHHDFYLAPDGDGTDPYTLRLVQDDHEDGQFEQSEGVICFDISTLPEPGEGKGTITLNWTKLDGTPATASFDYKVRQ